MRISVIILFFAVLASRTSARTITVDDNGPADFNRVQAAIDSSIKGDTVVVLPGIYKGSGNRDIDFKGKAITVRSSDPNDPCIVAGTVINAEGSEADQHRGFYFHLKEGPSSVLDGFTITGAYQNTGGSDLFRGGGIFCTGSSPTIRNCIISGNLAGEGGGIEIYYGSHPKVSNCKMTGNTSGNWGGGINIYRQSSAEVEDCEFSGNTGSRGGGIVVNSESSLVMERCRLVGNTAIYGGGLNNSSNNGLLIVTDCEFIGNTGNYGGGINCTGDYNNFSYFTNCKVQGNDGHYGGGIEVDAVFTTTPGHTIFRNCLVTDNIATYYGGIEIYQASAEFINCTIANNTATFRVGGMYALDRTTILNSIIACNTAPRDIDVIVATVSYSCVPSGVSGVGNIYAEPCFVDANNPDPNLRDYHLGPDSACIDAGDPNSDFGLEPEPDGGRINMGFYGNTPEATCKGGLVLQNYNLMSRTRVNRTTFDYVYTMTLNNNSPNDAYNVKVDLLDAPNNVTVNDANVSFDFIEAGTSAESDNTFAIRVDRAIVVDVTIISWRATYESANANGGTSETMFTTMIPLEPIPGDLVLDGVIDIEDLAVLLRQWIWEGETGAIEEDLTGDGKVNFSDLSRIGEHWQH
jgi:hypothetical protein